MYPLIPYKRILINTSLTTDEVADILTQLVRPRRHWFRFPFSISTMDGWEGYVNEQGFNINRTISYRNTFLPILHGRFHPTANGSEVEIRMTLHPLVMVILLFWYVFLFAAFIQLAVEWRNGVKFAGADLI